MVTHFFKGKKIIKFLNFIYNKDFFFPGDSNVELPMYMYVKILPGDLNSNSYLSFLTNIYTCEETITLRICNNLK